MNNNQKAAVEAPVLFDQKTHTYNCNGKELKGVTGILARQGITPDYESFKKNDTYGLLHEVADYGTRVHDAIESYLGEDLKMAVTPSVLAAIERFRYEVSMMMNVVHTEYLVSDRLAVATRIDMVLDDDSIVEVKSSPMLNELAIRWQLSIEAYLYELQENKPVPHLYCLQLNAATAKVYEMERIPDEEVRRLLTAELNGFRYVSPEYLPEAGAVTDCDLYKYIHTNMYIEDTKVLEAELKDAIAKIQRRLSNLQEGKKKSEAELKALTERLLTYALEGNINMIRTMFGTFVASGAQAYIQLDTRSMLKDEPALAAEFKGDPYQFAVNHPTLVENHSKRVLKMGNLIFTPEENFGYGKSE